MITKKLFTPITLFSICFSLVNSASANEFVDNKNGTITDHTIGITWQAEDDNVQRDWQAAKEYCSNLKLAGYDDWRGPNSYELNTLRIEKSSYPLIDEKLFSHTKADRYWSGSEVPYYPNKAFFSTFGKTKTTGRDEQLVAMRTNNKYYIRCIRGQRKRPKKR